MQINVHIYIKICLQIYKRLLFIIRFRNTRRTQWLLNIFMADCNPIIRYVPRKGNIFRYGALKLKKILVESNSGSNIGMKA